MACSARAPTASRSSSAVSPGTRTSRVTGTRNDYGAVTGDPSPEPGWAAPVAEPEPARDGVGGLAEVVEPPLVALTAAGVTLSDWHAARASPPAAARRTRA